MPITGQSIRYQGICPPGSSVFWIARKDLDTMGIELRPLTGMELVRALGDQLLMQRLRRMGWHLCGRLRRLGFLDTPEGARFRFSEDFRLDWWRVLRERARKDEHKAALTISVLSSYADWTGAGSGVIDVAEDSPVWWASDGTVHTQAEDTVASTFPSRVFFSRIQDPTSWSTEPSEPPERRLSEAFLRAEWAGMSQGESLPVSDRGRPDAVPLGPAEWTIPPDSGDWATQNKRICDLLAGR